MSQFQEAQDAIDEAKRVDRLEKRLAEIEKHAANLVATARNHFPKSIHNPDKFELELFSALLNSKEAP